MCRKFLKLQWKKTFSTVGRALLIMAENKAPRDLASNAQRSHPTSEGVFRSTSKISDAASSILPSQLCVNTSRLRTDNVLEMLHDRVADAQLSQVDLQLHACVPMGEASMLLTGSSHRRQSNVLPGLAWRMESLHPCLTPRFDPTQES
jgi:hypothetical protein